jgi:hypothetical protein
LHYYGAWISFCDHRLDLFFLRFEELAEQPFREAFVIVFVIVFEILLEAASGLPGKNPLQFLYSIASKALHSGQGFSRALRSIWLD